MKTWIKRFRLELALALAVALLFATVTQVYAAATLTSKIVFSLSGNLSNALDLVTATAPLQKTYTVSIASGTGSDQADVIWSDTRTVAASTTEDLDLAGGGLTDPLGVAFAPAKVKLIVVCAAVGNTNSVVVGGDVNSVPFLSTAATTVSVQPGGCLALLNQKTGIAVTAGTGDILQVANSGAGTSVTYDVLVIGTSA